MNALLMNAFLIRLKTKTKTNMIKRFFPLTPKISIRYIIEGSIPLYD
jgi:hypothetical protein